MSQDVYAFIFRGELTNQAIANTGHLARLEDHEETDRFVEALPFDMLDDADIVVARRMAIVYSAITAFERSARSFVRRVLIDEFGEEWWEKGVSANIRKSAESRKDAEMKIKWHGDRGEDLLDYTEMGHLPKIISANWDVFEPHVPRVDWATALFSTVERSRNIIMHSGVLDLKDVERVGMNIRDWIRQVGS